MARTTRVQGAIVHDNHLLIIKHREHSSGREYWLLPGGGVEAGETDEEGLLREMKEETHLDVAIERLLLEEPGRTGGVYQRFKTYLCRPLAGEARPGHEPEPEIADLYAITEVRWIDLRDEGSWDIQINADLRTHSLINRVRVALGYIQATNLPYP